MGNYDILSAELRPYGKVIGNVDVKDMLEIGKDIEITDAVYYERDFDKFHNCASFEYFKNMSFGGMDIQVGYCVGRNADVDTMEYHTCSEVNIAVHDMLITIGKVQDVENGSIASDKLDTFFVPAGTVVELYATTLHYSPAKANDNGYCSIVVLPNGTNADFSENYKKVAKDDMLIAVNKWVLPIK